MATERSTYPCATCGRSRSCRWVDDAWVCRHCGDEFYPESEVAASLPTQVAKVEVRVEINDGYGNTYSATHRMRRCLGDATLDALVDAIRSAIAPYEDAEEA